MAATASRYQRLEIFTASACPLLHEVQQTRSDELGTKQCQAWQEKVFEYLGKVDPGIVILAAADGYWTEDGRVIQTKDGRRFEKPESAQLLMEGLEGAVAKISNAGHAIILVQSVPRWSGDYGWSLDRCSLRDILSGCRMEMPLSHARNQSSIVRKIVSDSAKDSQATLVDFSEEICAGGLCETYRSGDYIYRDRSHLTNVYSESLSAQWDSALSSADTALLERLR